MADNLVFWQNSTGHDTIRAAQELQIYHQVDARPVADPQQQVMRAFQLAEWERSANGSSGLASQVSDEDY